MAEPKRAPEVFGKFRAEVGFTYALGARVTTVSLYGRASARWDPPDLVEASEALASTLRAGRTVGVRAHPSGATVYVAGMTQREVAQVCADLGLMVPPASEYPGEPETAAERNAGENRGGR